MMRHLHANLCTQRTDLPRKQSIMSPRIRAIYHPRHTRFCLEPTSATRPDLQMRVQRTDRSHEDVHMDEFFQQELDCLVRKDITYSHACRLTRAPLREVQDKQYRHSP